MELKLSYLLHMHIYIYIYMCVFCLSAKLSDFASSTSPFSTTMAPKRSFFNSPDTYICGGWAKSCSSWDGDKPQIPAARFCPCTGTRVVLPPLCSSTRWGSLLQLALLLVGLLHRLPETKGNQKRGWTSLWRGVPKVG